MTEQSVDFDDTFSEIDVGDGKDYKGIELRISLKIQYLGQVAHTIAFLKREAYSVLDIKQSENPKHLSGQLQVINLGYMGEDATIFELATTYVEYSFLPLFNAYKQGGSKTTIGLDNI
jgi:hypothetical protein